MEVGELEAGQERWLAAMKALAGYLYEQLFQKIEIAATLTLLEFPNLLAALNQAQQKQSPEEVVDFATTVEQLLANLGRPTALARVVAIREVFTKKLGDWSKVAFEAERMKIERLLEQGQFPAALALAQTLLQKSLKAGENAYDGADYDIALAHDLMGDVLSKGGQAQEALVFLEESRNRFHIMGEAGRVSAQAMASAAITRKGDCFRNLGLFDESANAYLEAITLDKKRNAVRGIAVGKGQLGTVRMFQKKYTDALQAHQDALKIFEQLGEPRMMATAWHQIGMVHQETDQFENAESAYRQSMEIKINEKDRAGEANSLNQLGNLYSNNGRLEEAVTFYCKAVAIFVELHDLANEGFGRSNVADKLIRLKRFAEAREELLRAIECNKPFGHSAQPWKTYSVLHNLEQAVNNPEAASKARSKARELFLAYRRDGGENHETGAKLCAMVGQAIAKKDTSETEETIKQLATHPDLPPYLKPLLTNLQKIIASSSDKELAEDPGLYYRDAVELQLLLESLAQ
ncbi:MAG: tetratricopeptide repeat protein [Magnetococcales bacterium]|nr:tetratricopeptide repeat protein [Magnetococcales bacterium]